jgi:predicted RND superfamily exporter protein
VSEEDWAKLRDLVPPSDLRTFDIADLPDAIAKPFTDNRGNRGTLVLVEANPNASNDVHTLVEFAASFRETRLPSGKVVRGSGSAAVFADIFAAVVRDVPRTIGLSLVFALAVVVAMFHSHVTALVKVLAALATALGGMAIYLFATHTTINFMNFAALPVTFGIGVDYAINVAQRYYADGERDLAHTLRTTGGAVVLCSLTTLLGYVVLLGSHNRGIRSLGAIASVGELCCLLAAVVVLPALLATRSRAPKPEMEHA